MHPKEFKAFLKRKPGPALLAIMSRGSDGGFTKKEEKTFELLNFFFADKNNSVEDRARAAYYYSELMGCEASDKEIILKSNLEEFLQQVQSVYEDEHAWDEMQTPEYKAYTGGSGPSAKLENNNNLAIARQCEYFGFETELTTLPCQQQVLVTIDKKQYNIAYDRWGYVVDGEPDMDQVSFQYLAEWLAKKWEKQHALPKKKS